MAIWQFYLEFVPRRGLLEIHQQLPSAIEVLITDNCFELNTEHYWRSVEVPADLFIEHVDKMVKRAYWSSNDTSFNWKTYSREVDHDAVLRIDIATNNIREFSFRADLREDKLVFLKGMLVLAHQMDCLVVDIKGRLAQTNFIQVKELILQSNANKFLNDPEQFLSDLDNKK